MMELLMLALCLAAAVGMWLTAIGIDRLGRLAADMRMRWGQR